MDAASAGPSRPKPEPGTAARDPPAPLPSAPGAGRRPESRSRPAPLACPPRSPATWAPSSPHRRTPPGCEGPKGRVPGHYSAWVPKGLEPRKLPLREPGQGLVAGLGEGSENRGHPERAGRGINEWRRLRAEGQKAQRRGGWITREGFGPLESGRFRSLWGSQRRQNARQGPSPAWGREGVN